MKISLEVFYNCVVMRVSDALLMQPDGSFTDKIECHDMDNALRVLAGTLPFPKLCEYKQLEIRGARYFLIRDKVYFAPLYQNDNGGNSYDVEDIQDLYATNAQADPELLTQEAIDALKKVLQDLA